MKRARFSAVRESDFSCALLNLAALRHPSAATSEQEAKRGSGTRPQPPVQLAVTRRGPSLGRMQHRGARNNPTLPLLSRATVTQGSDGDGRGSHFRFGERARGEEKRGSPSGCRHQ
ncbi:hypothetical protein MTO96_011997 [Rhipicephalus appendiculatus]